MPCFQSFEDTTNYTIDFNTEKKAQARIVEQSPIKLKNKSINYLSIRISKFIDNSGVN